MLKYIVGSILLYYFYNAGGKDMLDVFVKKSTEEMYVQLSNGWMMLLEDLVRDYERLLKNEPSKKTIVSKTEETYVKLFDGRMMPLEDLIMDYERLFKNEASKKSIISKSKDGLNVGDWFRIDRKVIDQSKKEIHYKCNEAGDEGKKLWKRFEESNKIADKNPDQYPRLFETYIFERSWEYKTEQEMRDMCEELGNGMCDEVICDLELQMRICNGESVENLVKNADRLPFVRVIKLRNGETGYFGGGFGNRNDNPPAYLESFLFTPNIKNSSYTPYAFRRVLL